MLERSVGDRPWRRAVARARVDYRVSYNLRHTHTTLMIRAGKPLQWIAHQLGHVGVKKIDEIYGRWTPAPEAQALDLEWFFLEIARLPKRAVVMQPLPNLSQTVATGNRRWDEKPFDFRKFFEFECPGRESNPDLRFRRPP